MNEDNFFLTNRGDLEERLDPVFYRPSIIKFIKSLLTSKHFKTKPLHKLALRIVDGPFGTQLKVEDYKEEGIPVIRVSNVRTGEISEDKLIHISEEKHRTIRRSRVFPDDVILTKAGAILGYSAVFPKHLIEGNITSHSVAITCTDEILPHYLKYIFHSEIGQRQIYRWGNKSTRPELNTQEVKKLIIPVLPIEQQQKIVDAYTEAIYKRKQLEKKAIELLQNIDEYFLEKLAICLPQEPANNIGNRMFSTSWHRVTGSRIDAIYHQNFFELLIKAISKSKYTVTPLKNVLSFIESGSRPKGGVKQISEGILSLGGEHVNDKCEVIADPPKFIQLEFHKKILRTQTKLHDVLIVKDGATTGKIGIIENHNLAKQNINEHVFMMRFSGADPHYITFLLNTTFMQKLIKREITGATVTGLTKTALKTVVIPLPELEIQRNISMKVADIRNEALGLQQKAITEFEKSKIEIQILFIR